MPKTRFEKIVKLTQDNNSLLQFDRVQHLDHILQYQAVSSRQSHSQATAARRGGGGSAQWRWRQQVLYPTKQRSLHKEKDTELFKADYKVLC